MNNLWDIIWVVVGSFVFIAYLMVFFHILTDLFSDHGLSGWFKGLWIIALIFVPFLGALIYLIARGQGMGERQLAAARRAQSQTDAYIQHVAGGKSAARTSRKPRRCWTAVPSHRPSSTLSRPKPWPERRLRQRLSVNGSSGARGLSSQPYPLDPASC